MASRSLNDLHPFARRRAGAFRDACAKKGIDVLIYCTARTPQEQAMLYRTNRPYVAIEAAYFKLKKWRLETMAEVLMSVPAQPGRTGKKRTNAMPGLSFHQVHRFRGSSGAMAVDFVPMRDGKPRWNDAILYRRAGEIGEDMGLTWSGRWERFKETCHVQFDDQENIDILQLAQGKYA